jgi:hypothetical protein
MVFTLNSCVYRTETLPKELLDNPEFKAAITKAEKRQAELKALEIVPEIEPVKKAYKKQDND